LNTKQHMQPDTEKLPDASMVKTGEIKILKNSGDAAWTVLGSCVSVIFHIPKKLSLISHAQMPMRAQFKYNCFDSCPHPCFNVLPEAEDFRYVTCSTEYMINHLLKNKIKLNTIHTSLLGGATSFYGIEKDNSVGFQNIVAAKSILAKYKIRINREFTAGSSGISVWFYAGTNKIFINKHKEEGKFELKDLTIPWKMV
jgi:chemotaxis receptor (MCP) glutamine deamidase CheD